MPAPPARERILDAYVALITDRGERAATLDAVAAAAGVSKGGLLYHFGSKEALTAGLIARLDAALEADLTRMASAPEGVLDYFVRGSVAGASEFDRAIVAVVRLAQGRDAAALAALHRAQRAWLRAVADAVQDETVARLVMLVSDGLYFNSALWPDTAEPTPYDTDVDALIRTIARLAETARTGRDATDDATTR